MTHKLIKTKDYLLVVDDSEIKEGDWYKTPLGIYSQFNGTEKLLEGTQKVSAHLPLKGSPILEGVPLLPPYSLHQEDDIDELAEYYWKMQYIMALYESTKPYIIEDFKSGYNKAREKCKYTEEDMRKAIDMATTCKHDSTCIFFNTEEIIQSLHQYPTEFETEDVLTPSQIFYPNDVPYSSPKTITTAQGVQWVGKYK